MSTHDVRGADRAGANGAEGPKHGAREHAQLCRYRFGSAEFDEARCELRVGGLLVELQQKPLQLLALLLSRPGEALSKDEIVAAVWRHPTGDAPLANAVSKLRAALGEGNAQAIVTVARQGYRFDGPLERVAVGRRLASRIELAAGAPVPGRERYQLVRLLGSSHTNETWLARHPRTGDRRVFKFAVDGDRLSSLKREATLFRVLREALGERDDMARVLDWNFESPPCWLECEYAGRSLDAWATEPAEPAAPAAKTRLQAASVALRLSLLLQAAEAVAAAHSVGVLHKDLKPANLLVEDAAQACRVRLTDFGSGHLLDPEKLDALRITQLGMTLNPLNPSSGTPFYMAPEVGRGEPATARSDVFALGVILYQLLAADLRRLMSPGWERDVDDELLREDIALATDLDPARRMASAAELAARLRTLPERHAARMAERAQAHRAQQQQAELVRARARRPWMLAALAALATGAGASLWLYQGERHATQALQRQFAVSQALNRLLREDLVGAASPAKSGRADTTVADALAAAAENIDRKFDDQAIAVRGSLHAAVQQALSDLSRSKEAVAAGRRAVAALAQAPPADRSELQSARLRLALDLVQVSQLRAAAAMVHDIESDGFDATRQPALFQVRLLYVKSWLTAGDFALKESTAHLERAMQIARGSADVDPQARRVVAFGLADAYSMIGRLDDAEALYRSIRQEQQREYGDSDARTLYTTVGLGRTLVLKGRLDEAQVFLQQAADGLAAALGPGHRQALTARDQLADLRFHQRDYAGAADEWHRVHEGFSALLGEGSSYTVTIQTNEAMAWHRAGRPGKAEPLLRSALGHLHGFVKDDSPQAQQVRYALADCLLDLRHPADVPGLLAGLDAEAINNAQQEPDWPARLSFQRARLAMAQGNAGAARTLLDTAAAGLSVAGTPSRAEASALLGKLR